MGERMEYVPLSHANSKSSLTPERSLPTMRLMEPQQQPQQRQQQQKQQVTPPKSLSPIIIPQRS
jgi:hypothetical protein